MEELKKKTNYTIQNKNLFEEAFTHKSCKNKGPNNERLEFLGDAVLNLVITNRLMKHFPDKDEGQLTQKRSQLISSQTLSEIATELELNKYLKREGQIDLENKRILSGTLEAYLGAIYLDAGFLKSQEVIESLFEERILEDSPSSNYKSFLQEWCQKKYKTVPIYKIKKEEGPSHKKIFHIDVFIKKEHAGSGHDYQKKQAEQLAAQAALDKLKIPYTEQD